VEPGVTIGNELEKAKSLFRIPFNPLTLSPEDVVLVETDTASEIRFVVDRISLMRRMIGTTEILSVDYVLNDPTDENISAAIRAYDDGKGGANLLLLRPDGSNEYNEDLEKMLNAMTPGSLEGFPRDEKEYAGYARPAISRGSYEVETSEYSASGRKTSTKTVWDFVREPVLGDPNYFFEMSGEDGYFYTSIGSPIKQDLIRAFRF